MKSKVNVNALHQKYAERFLSEWREEGRYIPTLKGSNFNEIRTFLEGQLEFARIYLGHMLIDGKHPDNHIEGTSRIG